MPLYCIQVVTFSLYPDFSYCNPFSLWWIRWWPL